MTSPNSGLHRAGLAILATGAAIGLSACGAGQISQTANQVAAVDGGSATVGDISVNDVRVVLPDSTETGHVGSSEATVAFTASYAGAGSDGGVTLSKVLVNGVPAQVPAAGPIKGSCSLVSAPASSSAHPASAPSQEKTVCISTTSVTLSGTDSLKHGQSTPVEFTFAASGRSTVLKVSGGVVASHQVAGEYTRPSEAAPSGSH